MDGSLHKVQSVTGRGSPRQGFRGPAAALLRLIKPDKQALLRGNRETGSLSFASCGVPWVSRSVYTLRIIRKVSHVKSVPCERKKFLQDDI